MAVGRLNEGPADARSCCATLLTIHHPGATFRDPRASRGVRPLCHFSGPTGTPNLQLPRLGGYCWLNAHEINFHCRVTIRPMGTNRGLRHSSGPKTFCRVSKSPKCHRWPKHAPIRARNASPATTGRQERVVGLIGGRSKQTCSATTVNAAFLTVQPPAVVVCDVPVWRGSGHLSMVLWSAEGPKGPEKENTKISQSPGSFQANHAAI